MTSFEKIFLAKQENRTRYRFFSLLGHRWESNDGSNHCAVLIRFRDEGGNVGRAVFTIIAVKRTILRFFFLGNDNFSRPVDQKSGSRYA